MNSSAIRTPHAAFRITRREALHTAACGFGYLALAGLAGRAAPRRPTRWRPEAALRAARPSASSSCSCRAASATSIPSTTSRGWTRTTARCSTFDDARVIANTGDARLAAAGDEAALEVRPARPERPVGVGPVPGDQPARRRPVLPPLAAHRGRRPRPGDAVPALRLDQLRPAVDGLVGRSTAWAPRTRTCPASSRSPRRPATAAPRNYGNAFLPAVYQGTAVGRAGGAGDGGDDPQPGQPARSPPRRRRGQFDLLRELNAEQLQAAPRRRGAGGGRQLLRAGLADAEATPRTCSTCRRRRPRRWRCTASARRRPTTSAGSA